MISTPHCYRALLLRPPDPPSEFSTYFSDTLAARRPEVLAVAPSNDLTLTAPPVLSERGSCLVDGTMLDDAYFSTKIDVHSGGIALPRRLVA